MKRRKWISPRSARAIERGPERHRVRTAALVRDRDRCQAEHRVPEVRCGGPLDPHELVPRSAWAEGQYVLDNVLTVCRRHHDWIDDNPAAAHDRDLHRFSWERPA